MRRNYLNNRVPATTPESRAVRFDLCIPVAVGVDLIVAIGRPEALRLDEYRVDDFRGSHCEC